MSKQIESPVGFSDSELLGYERRGEELTVRFRAWDERLLVVTFSQAIAVREVPAGDIAEAVMGTDIGTDLLATALARTYESVPSHHPYNVYAFVDVDGDPALEVVATECTIHVRDD